MSCPTCGAENAPGTPACARCGAPLAAQAPYTPPQPVFGSPPSPTRSSGPLVALLACGGCAILIVPILAAILFPVFAKARDRAQQSACMSTAKQLSLAVQQYAEDHGKRLPPGSSWEDAIVPYVGPKPNEVRCPKVKMGSGFVMNGSLAGRTTGIISDPANTVLLFEGRAGRNVVGGPTLAESRHGFPGRPVVVAFVDGHVQYVPEANLNRLRW